MKRHHVTTPATIYELSLDGTMHMTGERWCCSCHRMMKRLLDGSLGHTRTPAPYLGIRRITLDAYVPLADPAGLAWDH